MVLDVKDTPGWPMEGGSVTRELHSDCLFHGKTYKSTYQAFLNLVRRKIVKEKHVKRIGARLCLCQTSGDYLDGVLPTNSEELKMLKDKVAGEVLAGAASPNLDVTNEGVKTTLSAWDNMLANPGFQNQSLLRLAFLLEQALKGNYSSLNPPRKPKEAGAPQPQLITETFEMPIRKSYVRFLVGTKGIHLKLLLRQLNDHDQKDLKVQISRKSDPATNMQMTECVIKAATQALIDTIKDKLIALAKETERRREVAAEKTELYYERRLASYRSYLGNIVMDTNYIKRGVLYGNALALQEYKRDTYAKKHNSARKHDSRKSENTTKPPPVLEEGSRCINCLIPYTAEHLKQNTCKYHRGFIAEDEEKVMTYEYSNKSGNIEVVPSGKKSVIVSEKKWSCCGESAPDTSIDNQAKCHANTGCTSGCHNFRLTKNVGKKHHGSRQERKELSMGPKLQKGDKSMISYSHQDSVTSEYDEAEDEDLEEEYAPPKTNTISLADLIQKGNK